MVNFLKIGDKYYNVASIDIIYEDTITHNAILFVNARGSHPESRVQTFTPIEKVIAALEEISEVNIKVLDSKKE